MIGQRIEKVLVWCIILATAAMLFAAANGCAHLDPATVAKIDADKNAAAVKQNQAHLEAQARSQAAQDNPTGHPFASGNETVKGTRPALLTFAALGTLAFLVGLGLCWTTTFLSKLGAILLPVGASVGGGSWLLLFFLPFWPLILGGAVALLLGTLIYHLAKSHWDVTALFNLHQANLSRIIEVAKAPKTTITLNPAGGPNAPIAG